MKQIKVQFQWTELFTISRKNDTVRSIFRIAKTEIDTFTFEEIQKIHTLNYKGVCSPSSKYGYLTDAYREYSRQMSLDRLKQKVEEQDYLFIIELDYPWLRFTPDTKTKEELNSFNQMVIENGSLD